MLVGPARHGSVADATRVLETLGLEDIPLDDTAPVRLAEIRAATSLKLPDCCALLAAESTGATLATFDERLRRAAGKRGVATLP